MATGELGCGFFVVLGSGQRLKDALDLLYDLGVVLRVQFSEADHGPGDGQLHVFEDLGAGNADGLNCQTRERALPQPEAASSS